MSHKATNWLASLDPALLGHSEFRVLFHLCDCHNPSQGCFPTQAYLMANAGASNGTVNNVLNNLERKGLIKRHRTRDGKSKRQNPTRYTLGFEIKKEGGPTPETGDGKSVNPTPKNGGGAVSNLEADPTPTERVTRLQPTGEEPVNNQIINQRAAKVLSKISDIARFWIEQIQKGKRVPQSAISSTVADEIRGAAVLTSEQLKFAGIET